MTAAKRGKSGIQDVKYLPKVHLFAILCDNQLTILSRDLTVVQEIKQRKIHAFCLNQAVYKGSPSGSAVSQTDQICVATADKTLMYYEAHLSYGGKGSIF